MSSLVGQARATICRCPDAASPADDRRGFTSAVTSNQRPEACGPIAISCVRVTGSGPRQSRMRSSVAYQSQPAKSAFAATARPTSAHSCARPSRRGWWPQQNLRCASGKWMRSVQVWHGGRNPRMRLVHERATDAAERCQAVAVSGFGIGGGFGAAAASCNSRLLAVSIAVSMRRRTSARGRPGAIGSRNSTTMVPG